MVNVKELSFWTVVLEKILEGPIYNKIKPVNLKGNQPLIPAVSAEASTKGLQVERMDASTAKVPNHGSSNQTVCSPTHGEAQKGWGLCVPYVSRHMHCILPSSMVAKEGTLWALEEGLAQGSTGTTTYQVRLERTDQAYVAESWWMGVGQKGTSSPWSTSPKLPWGEAQW